MPIKDRIVTWYIRNILLPRREIIDQPGFILTSLSKNNQSYFLRDQFLSESLFELIEKKIVEHHDERGKQALYSAGKKFGYVYSSMSNFPTINNCKTKEFTDFAYFLVRFVEGTYAQQADHLLDLENKTFTITLDNYIICRNNGIGHVMTEGGIAGIWAYAMQDNSIEGIQLECQGRGNNKCILKCAPGEIIKERSNVFLSELDLPEWKLDNTYKIMNEIRPTKHSFNSLKKLLDARFFVYKNGIITYKNNRFFESDCHLLYFLEEEINKLEDGEQILFNTCVEYGRSLRELYGGKDFQKFIPDFFSALGFGDIVILDSKGSKIGAIYYPWTYLSKKSKYIIFRGIMSGIVSSSLDKKVEFNNYNVNINNYLTLTITI